MTALDEALATLAATRHLLVALDFDGTLSPLVDVPDEARALPEARAAMLRLVEAPQTTVALISGRALASLIHVSEPPEAVLLSGSHGVEARLGGAPIITLDEDETERIAILGEVLGRVADDFEHVWVEVKPAGFAVHSRRASAEEAAAAQARARLEATAAVPELTVRTGRDVIEFAVRSTDKGDAVEMLREASGASAVIFVGDDVTDEDGFAVLRDGDVGVKCGDGETAAAFRVADPAAVAAMLAKLAQLRS